MCFSVYKAVTYTNRLVNCHLLLRCNHRIMGLEGFSADHLSPTPPKNRLLAEGSTNLFLVNNF